ncbi:hypothetical protein P4O66_014177 [Electrophorus voltai]|uniref:Uncharacterized protein n=1 Tax=Electrophorus voltai TaxID=2609070 RepID=A0AAD9DPE0_9TELE|nr:hypothetical protein P4O66_014177 [Electrophorus voltai]
MELPDLQTIYYKRCQTKARRIVKDPTHPNNRLFSLLSPERKLTQRRWLEVTVLKVDVITPPSVAKGYGGKTHSPLKALL